MGKEERTCVVHEVDSALEGQVFEDLLQENGIPAMVSAYHDAAFDGYNSTQKGWGKVIVLAEDKEAAEKVISEYLASVEKKEKKKTTRKKRRSGR